MTSDGHQKPDVDHLFESVVQGGYCVGCGMCAAVSDGIAMKMDEFGRWVAVPDTASIGVLASVSSASVCPFAEGNPNEDEIALELFPDAAAHPRIGRYLINYAGFARNDDYRLKASSGGLVTWLLCRLLENGHADAVIHVGATESMAPATAIFGFTVSNSPDEVRGRAKSRYYPVEMSGVIRHMVEKPGRFIVVGLPCFIKALRLACRQSTVLQSRVAHTVGIVCGHLKSAGFAEMMGWQCGIEPEKLHSFDFRTKRDDAPANAYAITAIGVSGGREVKVTRPVSELFGTNWGQGLFKYNACDFCDDVLAETADISVGDAWLPDYVSDSRGTSIVVVRTAFFNRLLLEGIESGALQMDELAADRVAESQDAGLRHRREGLAFRLEEAAKRGEWVPPKRVTPGSFALSAKQREIYRHRQRLAKMSHLVFRRAKRAKSLALFIQEMTPAMSAYAALYRQPVLLRLKQRLWRLVKAAAANCKRRAPKFHRGQIRQIKIDE